MKLALASWLTFSAICLVLGQISDDISFLDIDSPTPTERNEHINVFNCSFEGNACDFDLVEPGDSQQQDSDDDQLRWFRRQAVILSNATVLFDRTKASPAGTLLFASGGEPGSVTRVETSLDTPAVNCSAALCCFNAYALMRQTADAELPGNLAFYIIQDSYGADPISTILANLSFTSFGNYWTNIQRTFHANAHPFRIAIEGRNGAGGLEFFLAVDDITITTGLCPSDEELFGHPGLCGAPPAVVAGEANIPLGHTLGAGTEISYNCMLGYDLIGPSTVTCMMDGQWSTPPICSPFRSTPYNPTQINKHEFIDPNIFAEEGGQIHSLSAPTDCIWGKPFSADTSTYDLELRDAQLYLFPENTIKCSGTLLRWVFLAAPVADGTPVYLSVWRPSTDGTTNQFKLVGFNQFTTKKTQKTVQFVIPAEQRFDVRAGDVIGIIHKRSSPEGTVFMYDSTHLPSGKQPKDLYVALSADIYIEDIAGKEEMPIAVDPSSRRRLLPLLQAYVGTTECPEQFLEEVTFSGINTVIPDVTTEDLCWLECRNQPSCYAVTFDSSRGDCRAFSYVSTEVHFTRNVRSMVKLCKADCDTKLLSDGEAFDLAFGGRELALGPELQTAADCELACRYTMSCTSFSYSNPFRPGTCILYSNASIIRHEANTRSFRKWGCADIDKLNNCKECQASFQCRGVSQCRPFGDESKSYCLPPGATEELCPELATQSLVTPCEMPPEIENGQILSYDKKLVDPTVYKCNSGYEMIGKAEVECVLSIWQKPLPSCRPACPNTPDVENGYTELLPVTSTKQATVTCNSGYRLVGNPVISCVAPKTWSKVPSCVADCGMPPGVGNARWAVVAGSQALPLSVRYDCASGFSLNGPPTLRCANGVWTPAPPSCQVNRPLCPAPPSLANGAITDSGDYEQNSTIKFASYKCLSGYELIGQPTIYCRGFSWEAMPVCSALCGPIPTVANAKTKILVSKNDQPTTVQYECLDGYQLEGDPIVSCISSLWGQPPKCLNGVKYEYCGHPPGVVYGSWRAILQLGMWPLSVEYNCHKNFYLVGPVRLTCVRTSASSTWQPAVVPLCQPFYEVPFGPRIHAPPILPIVNPQARSSPEQAPAKQGPVIPTSYPHRRPVRPPPGPSVVRILPGSLPIPGIMKPLGSFSSVGTDTSLSANPVVPSGPLMPAVDAIVPGSGSRIGKNFGIGLPSSGSQFIDNIVSSASNSAMGVNQPSLLPGQSMPFVASDAAAFAAPPSGGMRSGQSFGASRYFPYGGSIPGFGQQNWQLTGAPTVNDGMNIAAAIVAATVPPAFTSSSCDMVPAVANARYHILTGDKMSEVVRVRYVCYNGFEPTGPAEIECYGEGYWNPAPPLCRPDVGRFRHCGQPPTVPNSIIYPLPERPGEPKIIQYDCHQGFRLVGNHTLYCVDGIWRSAAIDAEPPKCIAVEVASTTTAALIPEAVAIKEPTPKQTGRPRKILPPSMEASAVGQRCKPPPMVKDAHIWLLNGTIDNPTEIEYHCQRKGYAIKGDSRVRCLNGTWQKIDPSSPPPACVMETTPEPLVQQVHHESADIAFTEEHLNDEVTYEYSECGPEPLVIHATSIKLSQNEVQYECMQPLDLVGDPVIYCSEDGLWSEPPYCIYVPTPSTEPPEEPSEKSNTTTESSLTSSTTTSTTPTTTVTTTVAQVEDKGFICAYSRPPVVRNAVYQVTKGTRKTPQSIRFHCLAGYEPIGPTDVHCQRDGTWGPPPSCIKARDDKEKSVTPEVPPQIFAEEYNPANGLPPHLPNHNIIGMNSRLAWSQPSQLPLFFNQNRIRAKASLNDQITTAQPEAYCWKMPHFLNGYFLAVPSPLHNGAVKSIRFVCKPGFVLFGPTVAECLPGEQWSSVPRCEPIPKPTKQTCKPVPFVEGAKFAVLAGSQLNPTRVRFICLKDMRMFAKGGTAGVLTCNNVTGNWEPEQPRCEPVKGGKAQIKEENDFLGPERTTPFLMLPPLPFTGYTKRTTQTTEPTTAASTTTSTTASTPDVTTIVIENSPSDCPPLPVFQGGAYHYVVEGPSAAAVLVCNEGFSMPRGVMPIVRCSFGKWQPSPVPTCQDEPGCALPIPSIANAVRTVLDNIGGRVGARFQCMPGFQMLGDEHVYCKNGAWTPLPSCRKASVGLVTMVAPKATAPAAACPPLPKFHYGFFEIVPGSAGLMSARFVCLPGYVLVGSTSITCINGKWPSPLPSCQGCGSPPFVANAFSEPLVGRGHSVRYRCQPGYELEGEPVVTCQQGFWSKAPKCRQKAAAQCGVPPVVANSQIVATSYGKPHDGPFADGHWVRYSCIPGFQLVPALISQNSDVGLVTCTGSRWSSVPTCEHEPPPVETGCFAGPVSPINSDVPLVEPTSAEMVICPTAFFSCAGYVNNWEIGALPSTTGTTVAFVSVWRRSDVLGAFQLVGANKVQPRPGIHMYEVQPSEQIRVQVGDFIGVYYADSAINGVVPYKIDTTSGNECLISSFHASRVMNELSRRGFLFMGSAVQPRQYILRAHIDNASPLCPELSGSSDPSLVGLVASGFGLAAGSKRLIECKPGFRLEGPTVVTCVGGQWKPSLPHCFPSGSTAEIDEIMGGKKSFNKFGKLIQKVGSRGKSAGKNKAADDEEEDFEAVPTLPAAMECGPPPKIDNGYAVRRSFETAEYECDPGFLLVGQRQVSCSVDEESDQDKPEWPTDSLPKCTDIRHILNPKRMAENAENAVDEQGIADADQCSAIPPTELPHSEPLIVQSARTSEALLCPQLVVNCTGIVDKWIFLSDRDDNASVILSVWRKIEDGRFVVVGANKFRVTHKGRIVKGVKPSEQFKAMRGDFIGVYYEEPSNGPVISQISPLGHKAHLMEEGGQLEDDFDCFAYEKFDNDIRQAMRNPGFLMGPKRARARLAAPPAVGLYLKGPLTCEAPPPLANGRIHAVGDSSDATVEKEEAAVGQRVVYTCDQGYHFNTSASASPLSGSITVTCSENGQWTPKPPSICVGNCPPPPVIENAEPKYSYSSKTGPQLDDSVRYECVDGFVSTGPPAIICQQNFTWSRPMPHCAKSCGEPPRVSHATVDYISEDGIMRNSVKVAVAGDSFSYSCHNGYLMVGRNVLSCTETGTWHPTTVPRCVVQCEPLPIIDNARLLTPSAEVPLDSAMEMETPVFTAGDRVTVQCEHGFISTSGQGDNTVIVCGDEGRWMKPLPRCLTSCGTFPTIENGRLQLMTEPTVLADPLIALAGQTAVIECAPGFAPVGGFDTITCNNDGTFGRLPVCETKSVSCRLDSIPYVANSILLSDSDNGSYIGAHRRVSCLPGYLLEGEPDIVCLANGEWSAPPKCELVDCGEPPSVMTAIANRLVLNNNNGTSVIPQVAYQFSCQYGYELVGKPKVTCEAADQSWSELPRCIDVGNPLCRIGGTVPNELPVNPNLPAVIPSLSREPVLADALAMGVDIADFSLCPSMRAVCTGEADRWIFLSQRDDGSIVVFGVWRPLSEDRYQLVGATRWAANAIGRQVITLDESTAIRVQIGDVIGVHYEQESEVPVVPSMADNDPNRLRNAPYPSCYRLPLNDADISMAMSSVNYVALSTAVSDPDRQISQWNRPAVQLLVRPARGCAAPAPVAHGHHNFDMTMNELELNGMNKSPMYAPPGHVVTFSCDTGYQLAGPTQISCQSDGTWAPAAPLCVPETPNCRVGHDWAMAPLPENAQLPGRWLTMYPSMRFGCSAEIVEWKVYSIATTPTQVFLDVWRKVTGEWFELVGSNNFTLTTPGLVSLRVPTTSRIMVDHDCFIGLHYGEIEQEDGENGPSTGAIAHWTAQSIEAANLTSAVELHDFGSRRLAERDLRSEIVGYHYVSMQHSQRQQAARTPAIVVLALTLPGCGVPKSIAWGSFEFDRSSTSLVALPSQPLSTLTTVGKQALYSCFEHFEMRGTAMATCTERGWTPAPMCIPKALCAAGFDPPNRPNFTSSGSYLMIFTSMQFKCDGIVTMWRFYSLAAGQTVYFGVWRAVNASSSNNNEIDASSYRLIGANMIRTTMANGVESHTIEQPLTVAVRRGDVVGIHYSSVSISASQLVIPFADDLEPRPWTRDQLFSGRVKPAAHVDIMSNGGVVQFDEPERKNWRIPALQAIVTASFIDCGAVPSVPHATLITGHGTHQSAVHRFACDEGYNIVGSPTIICNSDGQWSAVPTCKPIGSCLWNTPDQLPNKLAPSGAVRPESGLQQEVSQMVIYTSLPIRCTGLVKEWRFLTLANNNDGYQSKEPFVVHIDIWRTVSSSAGLQSNSHDRDRSIGGADTYNQEFVLVGTNTISIAPNSEVMNKTTPQILTYRVPPESQLFAVVGDYVGWHYDGPASPVSFVNTGHLPVVLVAASDDENADRPAPHEAILAPVFHASLRPGGRHRFASAVRRRLPAPRLEAMIDNAQVLPYGLCDGDTRCPANSDCLRRNCFAPACVCRDGFALNSNNTLCLPAVQLNQRCDSSVACEAFNSRCSERAVCECLSGWEPASDGRRCRPVSPTAGLAFALRGERCDATRQCYHRWYDQSCTEGVCRCRSGFRAATSIERRAFPHSATECRPVDYNLTSSDGWGDEAWSGDGTGGGGCSMSGQSSIAGALIFDPYPIEPSLETVAQQNVSLGFVIGGVCLVAVVGLCAMAYFSFKRKNRQVTLSS